MSIDAWIVGNLELPEGTEVFVPFDEEPKPAGNATIIVMDKEKSAFETAQKRIEKKGYTLMRAGKYNMRAANKLSEKDFRILEHKQDIPDDFKSFDELAKSSRKYNTTHFNTFWNNTEHNIMIWSFRLSKKDFLKEYFIEVRDWGRSDAAHDDVETPNEFRNYIEQNIQVIDKLRWGIVREYYSKATSEQEKEAYKRMIVFYSTLLEKLEGLLRLDLEKELKARQLIETKAA